jgi:uncharacterized glyoxalase superfamily protein PhnB
MAKPGKPVPEGMHTITPHLPVQGAARAIEFYKQAFGAQELSRAPAPDGQKVMHASLKIGDSLLFLADEFPEMGPGPRAPQSLGGTSVVINLYVEYADTVFKRAVSAGAQVHHPLADMFWGDRYGQVRDPFGHIWAIATHKLDLTPEEMEKGQRAFFSQTQSR